MFLVIVQPLRSRVIPLVKVIELLHEADCPAGKRTVSPLAAAVMAVATSLREAETALMTAAGLLAMLKRRTIAQRKYFMVLA